MEETKRKKSTKKYVEQNGRFVVKTKETKKKVTKKPIEVKKEVKKEIKTETTELVEPQLIKKKSKKISKIDKNNKVFEETLLKNEINSLKNNNKFSLKELEKEKQKKEKEKSKENKESINLVSEVKKELKKDKLTKKQKALQIEEDKKILEEKRKEALEEPLEDTVDQELWDDIPVKYESENDDEDSEEVEEEVVIVKSKKKNKKSKKWLLFIPILLIILLGIYFLISFNKKEEKIEHSVEFIKTFMKINELGDIDPNYTGDVYTKSYYTDVFSNYSESVYSVSIYSETVFRDGSIEIEVNNEYIDLGCKVLVDGKDYSDKVRVSNKVDTTKLGTYEVIYTIVIDEEKFTSKRTVKVIDTTAPIINFSSNDEVNMLINEAVPENIVTVTDNYDKEIVDVYSSSNLDTSKVGKYEEVYTCSDMSGNIAERKRVINVKEPLKVVAVVNETKVQEKKVNVTTTPNTVTANTFTNTGFYIAGHTEQEGELILKLNSGEETKYEFKLSGEKSYTGNIDISSVENGSYDLYINDKRLVNKMDAIRKLARAKVGNKILDFVYNNDEVSIKVSDHSYLYDVLIDVGHGGWDTGAVNQYVYEKDMNLTQSRYEKCRYESMGLRVLLTRNDDSYGSGMGPTSNELQRRSYFMGYYGVQSKVIYSNHHNSIGYYSRMGFEMIGSRSLSDIGLYKSIYNDFSSNYPTTESHMRFYTRDYDNDGLYDKSGGQTYNFRTYYAVIRIPEEIFNINNIILYEGCYLSNTDDWRWYWESGNWKKFSEIKIKHYVESIGVTYVEDNGGC